MTSNAGWDLTNNETVWWITAVLVEKTHIIIRAYCGSLFTGHCTSDQFVLRLGLDLHYLFQIGMDDPNLKLAFKKKLRQYFEDELCSLFLSIGSCSLHPVHTTFRKRLEALTWYFVSNIYSFLSFLVPGRRTMVAWNMLKFLRRWNIPKPVVFQWCMSMCS